MWKPLLFLLLLASMLASLAYADVYTTEFTNGLTKENITIQTGHTLRYFPIWRLGYVSAGSVRIGVFNFPAIGPDGDILEFYGFANQNTVDEPGPTPGAICMIFQVNNSNSCPTNLTLFVDRDNTIANDVVFGVYRNDSGGVNFSQALHTHTYSNTSWNSLVSGVGSGTNVTFGLEGLTCGELQADTGYAFCFNTTGSNPTDQTAVQLGLDTISPTYAEGFVWRDNAGPIMTSDIVFEITEEGRNASVYIGDVDGSPDLQLGTNGQTYTTINMSVLMLEGNRTSCDCQNCTLSGDYCEFPLIITSETSAGNNSNFTLELNLLNISYFKSFEIINEKTGKQFDVNNLTGVKLFDDANRSVIDYQALGANITNVTLVNNKWRLELEYADGTIINRYIDTDLTALNTRLCANIEGTTHFEQLIVSSVVRKATLRNLFSNCFVAADFTRFAYQNSYVLRAFTIPANYELSVFDDQDNQFVLSQVDGGIESFMNLDTIEFSQEGYNLDVLGDTITFQKIGNETIQIYYTNEDKDNSAADVTIRRTDTNAIVYNSNTFVDPNQFTIIFDWSQLSGINQTTVFVIDVVKTTSEGEETLTKYFNVFAKPGFISSMVAFVMSFILMIFGFTFTLSRLTFSWFGILITLMALGILSFSIITWYITLLAAVELIILVYSVITMISINSGTVS